MTSGVEVNAEDKFVYLYGCDGSPPVYVHKHLLYERCEEIGDNFDEFRDRYLHNQEHDDESDDRNDGQDKTGTEYDDHIVMSISLTRRALVMYARNIYGREMWDPHEGTDANEDLESLAEIYDFCWEEGDMGTYDGIGFRGCVEAVCKILSQATNVLEDPLEVVQDLVLHTSDWATEEVAKALVYGDCGKNGRTKEWIQMIQGRGDSDWAGFIEKVALEFATKASKESAEPDA